ncbi:MAG: hypothetical protein QM473_10100 [Acidobacteriota bacterium]|jgi:hypothetical protein|nr:hypothetical protein [Acidobacteriota bacterium]
MSSHAPDRGLPGVLPDEIARADLKDRHRALRGIARTIAEILLDHAEAEGRAVPTGQGDDRPVTPE